MGRHSREERQRVLHPYVHNLVWLRTGFTVPELFAHRDDIHRWEDEGGAILDPEARRAAQ